MDTKKGNKGFSLLEMIISITLLGIIAGYGVPAMGGFIQSVRANIMVKELYHALKYARSEAVTRSAIVRLCASSDGRYCSKNRHWEDGWIVYIDRVGKSTRDDTDPILQTHSGTKNLTIRKNGLHSTIRINERGFSGSNWSFHLCAESDNKPFYRLIMIQSGRLRTTTEGIRCPP